MSNSNDKNLPLVVIFGRTNVGKSTLFNALVEKKQALVADIPGTTRDSNIGQVSWGRLSFNLIDTGGIIDLKYLTGQSVKTNDIEVKVQQQARQYLDQADLILFLVDNKTGLLPQDKQMALILKKTADTKKIILVVNKVDSPGQRAKTAEFFKLALGDVIAISAANGSGTGDLLDIVVKRLESRNSQLTTHHPKVYFKNGLRVMSYELQDIIKVCIIGKPNVGKSSLLNSLLGYQRVIVSPIPHTTREPQDTDIIYQEKNIKLIDTAGISKKGAKTKGLEKYGIAKSLGMLTKADIALLVLDISEGITHQDAKLIEEILNQQKSLILIANKWDLIKARDTKKYTNYIYGKLPFTQFVPIQFTSALTGEKVKKILDLILAIDQERKLKLGDSQLNKFLLRLVKIHRPAKGKGVKHPRIYEFKQIAANPPRFIIRLGPKDNIHFSYLRFMENRLRENFGFTGTPITIKIAKNKNLRGQHKD